MAGPIQLSKSDARRAMIRHHFAPSATLEDAFHRLRSVQMDPIAPAGCNHDLVLQARVPGYRVGDWMKSAYEDRFLYDGWDKQASLVPFTGWPVRRIYHDWYQQKYGQVLKEYPEAAPLILGELEARGALMSKEFELQIRRDGPTGGWNSNSVTRQVLRALWHSGLVMTSGRRQGQHLYDLTERVVPKEFFEAAKLSEDEAILELVLDRHRAKGLLRPNASVEIWSFFYRAAVRQKAVKELVARGEIVPVEVEGVLTHATPEFLALLDLPSLDPEVTFVGPLDQLMWDRKLVMHLFGFEYIWEIYVPEAKRRWGYYVLPVRFGDALVARVEVFCRGGVLEIRRWFIEGEALPSGFGAAFQKELASFMGYCGATSVSAVAEIPAEIRGLLPA